MTQLRWDSADTVSYFYSTQTYLQPILLLPAEAGTRFSDPQRDAELS